MEEKDALAAVTRYKKKFLDSLQKRMDLNHEYILEGGYEKECKEKNVDPDQKVISKMKIAYDKNSFTLKEGRDFYKADLVLLQAREATISTMIKVYASMRDNIVSDDTFPSQLMEEQVDMMNENFKSLKNIVEPKT